MEMAARRREIDPATRARWDQEIGARLVAWSEQQAIRSLAVYWAIKGEPDLGLAYAELAQRGVALALPVVFERDKPLAFAHWRPGEPMLKDEMGIAVPAELRVVPVPQALVIPCLAFNDDGFRLGYGGGFYDRTLEKTPRPLTVGVAYSVLRAEFPSAPHDVALDAILTEA